MNGSGWTELCALDFIADVIHGSGSSELYGAI